MSYWSKVRGQRISRRRVLSALGAGTAAAAFLAACGGDDDDDDDEPAGGSSGGATGSPSAGSGGGSGGSGGGSGDAIQRGGNLRVGTSADLLGTDSHVMGSNRATIWYVTEGLTDYDSELNPLPRLAESWEQPDGGATIVFKLRQGVTYHSGREFTAEDVRWNLERVKDPNQPYGQFRTMANWYPTIEVTDPYTIVLKGDSPRASTFDFFMAFRMVDSETLDAPTAVGTGPWKWTEWRQGESMKWERYAEYWRPEVPYLDEVNWQLALDPEAALAHLEAGALDVLDNPSFTGFLRLKDDSNFQTMLHPNPGAVHANGFNCLNPPFDDPRVRTAFNWALDRQRLQDVVMRGASTTRSLPWPETSLAFEADKDQFYSLDLQKAADLLSAANVSGLSTGVTHSRSYQLADFLPIWQEDLKSIGVDLRLDLVEAAAFPPIVNGLEHDSVWAAGSGNGGGGEPISRFTIGSGTWGGDGENINGYTNPEYQALIDECAVELDPEARRAIYSQLNDILLESSQVFALGLNPGRLATTTKVNGIKASPHDSFDYIETWLA